MKKLLLLTLIALCSKLSAAEYGSLYIPSDRPSSIGIASEVIQLSNGDIFEILDVIIDDNGFRLAVKDERSKVAERIFIPSPGRNFVGPCQIYIKQASSYPSTNDGLRVFYKLTRASEVKTVTNSITIPAITNQEWAVTLERSTDLTNWETVAPGTVTGTDSLQFFRLRVGGETTTVESTSTGGE